jgi:hypothetical protein
LKVYGRKFPVFDNKLLKQKRWRAVVRDGQADRLPAVHGGHARPLFVSGGRDFLLATARKAIEELRDARAPGRAFPANCSPTSCLPRSSRRWP